jgi:hypothetical protein
VLAYSDPGDALRVRVRSAGRLLISAVVGLDDLGAENASPRVTIAVNVDKKVESEAHVGMTSGQVIQVPTQALVHVSAGTHTAGLRLGPHYYSSRSENVLVVPVSIIATVLPAAPAH